MTTRIVAGLGLLWAASAAGLTAVGAEQAAAERGYRVLTTKPFLSPDFDQDVFDHLWEVWPEPLRAAAEAATPAERRKMAFSRYGLMEPPGEKGGVGPGLGYVATEKGWVMNCLTCHGGKVAGRVVPGLPNSHYALETLTEDVRATKLMRAKPLSHLDLAQLKMPLGTSVGTTNSVMFGVALGALRNPDMSVDRKRLVPELRHHDMDPPPFWNVKKKRMIYCDGFAPKNHRVLMQFMLLPSNGKATVEGWENDFRDVLAWIESVEPPKYPFKVDAKLAARGETLFNDRCAHCHGTYGEDAKYPEVAVDIAELGTDPLRLRALSRPHRQWMKVGWMSRYGDDPVDVDPKGYVAPPLDGVWASAPYFHNGSVPTLWHVLHPDRRPKAWTRIDENGYDRENGGLVVESRPQPPEDIELPADRRRWFDTTKPGKSAAGHRFPEVFDDEEKRAVLEYLKTL